MFPHRGNSAAVTALLSGDVDVVIAPGTAILSHIEAGTFRALAISTGRRWPNLPDVPTVAETVAPGYGVMAWMSVATPRGVPRAIVERLNTEIGAPSPHPASTSACATSAPFRLPARRRR